MSSHWTVKTRFAVHAELARVAAWWTDEKRFGEWRSRFAATQGVDIDWRESRGAEGLVRHEGSWKTRNGVEVQFTRVRHPAPLTPDETGEIVIQIDTRTGPIAPGLRRGAAPIQQIPLRVMCDARAVALSLRRPNASG
jgi:hypothetical protein